MTETINYKLKKPVRSEFYNIEINNSNFEIIDNALKNIENLIEEESKKKINLSQLSNDGTFVQNSKELIPSQNAVVAYVKTKIEDLANTLGINPDFATNITALANSKIEKAAYTAFGDILVGTGPGTYIKKTISEIIDLVIPVGFTTKIHSKLVPTGFIKKNGVLLSRTTYANLWAYAQVSGNIVDDTNWSAGAFGSFSTGDGTTTFRIPDDRGYFERAWDDGRGIDSGRIIGSTQSDQNLAHTHTLISGDGGGYSGPYVQARAGSSYATTTNSSGSTEARPKNIALMSVIKY